jgi:hypothetical protein
LAAEAGLGTVVASRAFARHKDFIEAFGPAGSGREWHHLVLQHEANLAKFGALAIHDPSNYVNITKEMHWAINRIYNSRDLITGKYQWEIIAEMPFAQQREIGLKILDGVGMQQQFQKAFEGAANWMKAIGGK